MSMLDHTCYLAHVICYLTKYDSHSRLGCLIVCPSCSILHNGILVCRAGVSRGPSDRISLQDPLEENAHDLRNRIEHLANFRTFMQVGWLVCLLSAVTPPFPVSTASSLGLQVLVCLPST